MADERHKLDLNRDFADLLQEDREDYDAELEAFIDQLILILILGGLL